VGEVCAAFDRLAKSSWRDGTIGTSARLRRRTGIIAHRSGTTFSLHVTAAVRYAGPLLGCACGEMSSTPDGGSLLSVRVGTRDSATPSTAELVQLTVAPIIVTAYGASAGAIAAAILVSALIPASSYAADSMFSRSSGDARVIEGYINSMIQDAEAATGLPVVPRPWTVG
jgi:hypothetical protein